MAGKVTIKDNSATWLRMQLVNLDVATRAMADATVKTSKVTAPLLNGPLRNSSRIERNGPLNYSAVYGGGSVQYAAYQERGMRKDGSHKVRHYTTPGTGAHFLRNAGDVTAKQGIKAYL
jgi:hypothetical protein